MSRKTGLCEGDGEKCPATYSGNLEPRAARERLKVPRSATIPALKKDGVRPGQRAPTGPAEWLSLMTSVWAFDRGNRNQVAVGDGGLNGQCKQASVDHSLKKLGCAGRETAKLKREVRQKHGTKNKVFFRLERLYMFRY